MGKRADLTTRFLIDQPVLREGEETQIIFIRVTRSKCGDKLEYTSGWGWEPQQKFKAVPTNKPRPDDICTWYDDVYGEVAIRVGRFTVYLRKKKWIIRVERSPIVVGRFSSFDACLRFIDKRGDFLLKRWDGK